MKKALLTPEVILIIGRGVGFPVNRSAPPGRCNHIPRILDHLKELAGITYEQLDELAEAGLVELTDWGGFGNAIWTYAGLKLSLELGGWKRETWYNRDRACCNKAVPAYCVCEFRSRCPDHGSQCHGSHD